MIRNFLKDLSRKNVLITGGGTGLGKEMAKSFYDLGSNVVICSRKKDVIDKTVEEIHKPNNKNKFQGYELDVRNVSAIHNLRVKLLTQNMFPHIVINNAAANFLAQSKDLSENAWNTIIDIVLKGTLNMTTIFGNHMINTKQEGTFINISTTYADTGSAFVVPSGMAKAGCNNLVRSLATEWGKHNIRFVGVAPGPIYTDGAFSRLDPSGRFTKELENILPLGRLATPQELAAFICYLSSDIAKPINGQIINFDGGETVLNSGEFNKLLRLKETEWNQLRAKL